jgi:hypothetical protein
VYQNIVANKGKYNSTEVLESVEINDDGEGVGEAK